MAPFKGQNPNSFDFSLFIKCSFSIHFNDHSSCFYFYTAADEAREQLLADEPENGGSVGAKIEVRDLTKVSDKDVPILNKVNVDIPGGVIMGVIGPSGSGKSTFLRALNRLWEPASASVFLDGVDICELDVLNLRRKVGMLFQLPVLFQGKNLY